VSTEEATVSHVAGVIERLHRDEGASAVEYAVLAALIAGVIAGIVSVLGLATQSMFGSAVGAF